jgi:maltooligosyltrehalose trehalohydrolase
MIQSFPNVGAQYHNGLASFTVWAPLKKNVELVIGENKEHFIPMQLDEFGYWNITVETIKPGSAYWFNIDNEVILPDPASRSQPLGIHGPSEVLDSSFEWTDQPWSGLPLKDMVIYELHVGTFSPEGTFDGVIGKLSYLKELGVNAIELLPVAQFPGSRNWGYDGVYPFAVQHTYGGPNGLKNLVNQAHQQGIAIILDVVYNHLGPEGNYFMNYAPYFTDKYKTFWGKAMNFDDAYCDGVRNFYWQNALMWLDEFHIDGLRLDAVHAIWDFSARHFIEELVSKVRALQSESGKEKVLIAEFDLNNPRYIIGKDKGGYGMDGQWVDEFHHALHSLITGERDGYYEDFGEVQHLVKALESGYVYTGEYSKHRRKHFGVFPENCTYGQFVVFSQNHDQVGNRKLGDRLTNQLSFEALKLVAATYLLAPQVPMLFMGEEYGERNPFQYFISHTDESLIEMVRKGRREEFAHFKWEGEVPDPQNEETFLKCKLSWNYNSDKYQRKLLDLYTFLISFRKQRLAYQGKDLGSVYIYNAGLGKVIAFEKSYETDRILVILNFDKSPAPFRLTSKASPPSQKIFDSSALKWLGPGEITFSKFNGNNEILLHPESFVIFEY